MVRAFLLCWILAAALLATAPARAQEPKARTGIALVVGQSSYLHIPKLPNPARDARAVEVLLENLGFRTDVAPDRTARQLRRDLEGFVEDAQGVDVALIYYSGHGIEAGGESYLVPTDADLSALDDASEKLVPVSEIVRGLGAAAKVVIVVLDACRDNPFPPGSLLRATPGDAPVPVAIGGLAAVRSAQPIASLPRTTDEAGYGTVIAFAAEPGKTALDGAPGGNSPYATAVLRHFDAMAGEEFGTVMRMVAEEVYLKTGGRQRPWVNESLRRLLYFGRPMKMPAGEEGDILRERRQLLLTIADLPDPERRRIEAIARESDVPIDAVYAILKAIGVDVPRDPAALDKMLRAQAVELKALIARRDAVERADPELKRLSDITDRAVAEGALDVARQSRAAVDGRIEDLAQTLEQETENLSARWSEIAAEFAKTANLAALDFDYQMASDYYGKAFAAIERWDSRLAWEYKLGQSKALISFGSAAGGVEPLHDAVDAADLAVRLSERFPTRAEWVESQMARGEALNALSYFEFGSAHVEQSIAAYRLALGSADEVDDPTARAAIQVGLGDAMTSLVFKGGGAERIEEILALLRPALEDVRRLDDPTLLISAQNSLAVAIWARGQRQGDESYLRQALQMFRDLQAATSREDAPEDWAKFTRNVGITLVELGVRQRSESLLREGEASLTEALQAIPADREPLRWGYAQMHLGNALWQRGRIGTGTVELRAAVAAYEAALGSIPPEADPRGIAGAQNSIGHVLSLISAREKNTLGYEEAARNFRAALDRTPRHEAPLYWASMQANLGAALRQIGWHGRSRPHLEKAIAAFRAALEEQTPRNALTSWRFTQEGLARALSTLSSMLWAEGNHAEAGPLADEAYQIGLTVIREAPNIETSQNLGVYPDCARVTGLVKCYSWLGKGIAKDIGLVE